MLVTVESQFLEPPDKSSQKSNTVILPPISWATRSFKPIFVSLAGLYE